MHCLVGYEGFEMPGIWYAFEFVCASLLELMIGANYETGNDLGYPRSSLHKRRS